MWSSAAAPAAARPLLRSEAGCLSAGTRSCWCFRVLETSSSRLWIYRPGLSCGVIGHSPTPEHQSLCAWKGADPCLQLFRGVADFSSRANRHADPDALWRI